MLEIKFQKYSLLFGPKKCLKINDYEEPTKKEERHLY